MVKLTIHDEQVTISDAFAFAARVHELGNSPEARTRALWFRGQPDACWELKPSVGRRVDLGGLFDGSKSPEAFLLTEKYLLQRFRRDAYPFVERALTDWEALTIGQHHKLPTRLLDWTSNPLAGLFFAAETHLEKDGAIFAYRPRGRDQWGHHVSMFKGENPTNPCVPDPFDVRGIKLVFPMLLVDRLVAQSGGFTIQDPLKCLMKRGDEEFDDPSLDIHEIYKWRVPAEHKEKILDELHRVKVNRLTLFPGLDGVGEVLRVQEKYRL